MNSVLHGDCLELMKELPDSSVDMILCDLPYGTIECKWDTVIPFEPLWEQYKRIIKPDAAIVLFGAEPFSSLLRASNMAQYKYDWIWEKGSAANVMQAKNAPLKRHEIISVFSSYTIAPTSSRQMRYYPQGLQPCSIREKTVRDKQGVHGKRNTKAYIREYTNYPSSVLRFSHDTGRVHPTQKPVALFEYLIKTYTNESETVLDNCAGSGTTAIAALRTNRKYILMEKEAEYVSIIHERIKAETEQPRLLAI